MNKLNSFKAPSLDKNNSNQENYEENEIQDQQEKVLCNHCGRTSSNGIRCQGICVADNDY
tara:strand:+ start:151 stop:330 length:180 start_codon:yes stop_codon:yes gene_type:complete